MDVVPVLHAAVEDVPVGAVGDALCELAAVVHGAVCVRVDERQAAEECVVGAGLVAAAAALAVAVERVVGHLAAAVEVGRQHERVGAHPVHDGLRLGLARRGAQVEAVREVAVEVEAVAVGTLAQLEAVRVHRGQHPHAHRVHQLHHLGVAGGVPLQQVCGEAQAVLAAHHLVAVHVAHVLEVGLWLADARVARDLQRPQLAALHAVAHRGEPRHLAVLAGQLLQCRGQLLVVVVAGEAHRAQVF
mmetsp:Transcript_28224/g.70846  ORF Transcript_28224/g.70846 Transcript_28224/m.70846 type:complete len:245 (+) Transcript_28224:635-1369(+)